MTAKTEDHAALELTFGADFDLYDGLSEVRATLHCSSCGADHPEIHFLNTAARAFEDVSFEESVVRTLEQNAFWRARDRAKVRYGR